MDTDFVALPVSIWLICRICVSIFDYVAVAQTRRVSPNSSGLLMSREVGVDDD